MRALVLPGFLQSAAAFEGFANLGLECEPFELDPQRDKSFWVATERLKRALDDFDGEFVIGYSLGGRLLYACYAQFDFPKTWPIAVVISANPGVEIEDRGEKKKRDLHFASLLHTSSGLDLDAFFQEWNQQAIFRGRSTPRLQIGANRDFYSDILANWSWPVHEEVYKLKGLNSGLRFVFGSEDLEKYQGLADRLQQQGGQVYRIQGMKHRFDGFESQILKGVMCV